jgi:hypothetical protein
MTVHSQGGLAVLVLFLVLLLVGCPEVNTGVGIPVTDM